MAKNIGDFVFYRRYDSKMRIYETKCVITGKGRCINPTHSFYSYCNLYRFESTLSHDKFLGYFCDESIDTNRTNVWSTTKSKIKLK